MSNKPKVVPFIVYLAKVKAFLETQLEIDPEHVDLYLESLKTQLTTKTYTLLQETGIESLEENPDIELKELIQILTQNSQLEDKIINFFKEEFIPDIVSDLEASIEVSGKDQKKLKDFVQQELTSFPSIR